MRMVNSRSYPVLTCLYSSFFGTLFYSSFVGVMFFLLSNNQHQLRNSIYLLGNQNKSFFTDYDSNPIVRIPSLGKVMGSFSTSSKGRNYSAFRGIPYAKPPIGELRFKVMKLSFTFLFLIVI